MEGINIGYELSAFIPSIGVGLIFWYVLRSIFRIDRTERDAEAAWDREHPVENVPAETAPIVTEPREN